MNIRWGRRFKKEAEKMPQYLRDALFERIGIFLQNPFAPILDNRQLKGTWRGYRSINITGDWRLIYEQEDASLICFVRIGTHHELFGS